MWIGVLLVDAVCGGHGVHQKYGLREAVAEGGGGLADEPSD